MTPIDSYLFRQLCGRFATGVTIITTLDGQGNALGMTANSFASVSLEPPMISVAIDHTASMHDVLRSTDHQRFVVNILDVRQESLSRRFASGIEDRFDGVGWHAGASGDVLLDGALAHICCERVAAHPVGDHTLIIGSVVSGSCADHARPLLYYRGGYADLETL